MTLEQTVEIPSDRWVNLRFEAPREIPTGSTAKFNVIWFHKEEDKTPQKTDKPFIGKDGKIHFTKKQWDEMMNNSPITQSLCGIVPGMSDLTDEELDEIRYEALAEKHLK